jgi:hypothetical protein
MAGNYLGRAGAYALHKKYPSGQQTASQLASERANLQRARMKRGLFRHTKSAQYRGLQRSTIKSRESSIAARLYNEVYLNPSKSRALGIRYMRYRKLGKVPLPKVRGIPKKFVKNLSSGSYMGRTHWGSSRKHKMRKRLYKRSFRLKQIKHWKYRGHRYTPR